MLQHGELLTEPALWLDRRHRRVPVRHLVLSRHRGHLPGGRGSALAGPRAALGTMAGMITLLIAAALTWYVCAGLLPWEYLGPATFAALRRRAADRQPDAGDPAVRRHAVCRRWPRPTAASTMRRAPGSRSAATAICRPGSRRCIPRYRTPYRSILFLMPIALAFAFTGLSTR